MYNSKNKTPISYYGGKQSIIKHLLPYADVPHTGRTEAYFGGGAFTFALDPVPNEIINDKWDILINFYRVLKLKFRPLKKLIESSLISRTMYREAMGILNNPGRYGDVKIAWAFWYCANWSYANKIGGGLKISNTQNTAVPVQLVHKKQRFTEELVHRLENVTIENNDALAVLRYSDFKHFLHYIDTPYFNADMGHYKGFTQNDLETQLDWCASCNGFFVLSNYNSDILTDYINQCSWYKKEVTHRIKAPRKTGIAKVEVIVSNFNPSDFKALQLFQ